MAESRENSSPESSTTQESKIVSIRKIAAALTPPLNVQARSVEEQSENEGTRSGVEPPSAASASPLQPAREEVSKGFVAMMDEEQRTQFNNWFAANTEGLEAHKWFQANARVVANEFVRAEQAIAVLSGLIPVAIAMLSDEMIEVEKHVTSVLGGIEYEIKPILRMRLVCQAAVDSQYDVAATTRRLTAKLQRLKERASHFETRADTNAALMRKARNEQKSLVDLGWVTEEREIADRVAGVDQANCKTVAVADGKILFTSGVGGCLAVAAIGETNCFIAHFDPPQIGGMKQHAESSSDEKGASVAEQLVCRITESVGVKLRVYLASPSLDAKYIQLFREALVRFGHAIAGEFKADRLAINSSTGEVSTKFDWKGLPLS